MVFCAHATKRDARTCAPGRVDRTGVRAHTPKRTRRARVEKDRTMKNQPSHFFSLPAVLAVATIFAAGAAHADSFDPSRARLVDLTHPFNTNSIYWPTTPS